MSLEIIEYKTSNSSESELLATIKQRTGLELEALDSGSSVRKTYSVRFPDMETSQNVSIAAFSYNGTLFIDTNNHFLCYTISSGLGTYDYVDYLYKTMVCDFNGKLSNVCGHNNTDWEFAMNIHQGLNTSYYYIENDHSKSDITLCPLRACGSDANNSSDNSVRGFVKNCYVNYERQFQRDLKFIDQNGNRFVTLGGYLLYKID